MSDTSAIRKLTTIFYADIAGYSRLTGDDELRTHREVMDVLDYANKTIGDRRGVVLRYAGDAILAEFSSVVSCVEAAVDIQQELARRNRNIPRTCQNLKTCSSPPVIRCSRTRTMHHR
jgi:class 3 adenylate cyclase